MLVGGKQLRLAYALNRPVGFPSRLLVQIFLFRNDPGTAFPGAAVFLRVATVGTLRQILGEGLDLGQELMQIRSRGSVLGVAVEIDAVGHDFAVVFEIADNAGSGEAENQQNFGAFHVLLLLRVF